MIDKILGNLEWLGHDCFRLTTEDKVIYFDPFQLAGELPPADIVFITHEHYDHFSPEDLERVRQDSTIIVTEPDTAGKLAGQVKTMAPGERIVIESVEIEAVCAYNTNKKFHPRANNWLGFIVTVDGVSIYHAGDTDHIPEMKGLRADIALLPVSGTYVMTAEEAVRAALDIGPQVAIPMHFGAIVGEKSDAERFAEGLQGKIRVHIPVKKN